MIFNKTKRFVKGRIIKAALSVLRRNDLVIPIDDIRPNDIIVAGYPKSGNTWMQTLVSGLVFGVNTNYLPPTLANELVVDVHTRNFYKRFNNEAYFKSHNVPQKNYKNVIYIVRDGRDAMVSYFAMNTKLGMNVSMDEMIIDGKGIFPCKWHEHVRSWVDNPFNANMIIIKYEDLIRNPIDEMNKICDFIGVIRSSDEINQVIAGSSFEKAVEKASKFNRLGHMSWDRGNAIDFYRKGKIGSYKDDMKIELLEYFNKESINELNLLDYKL